MFLKSTLRRRLAVVSVATLLTPLLASHATFGASPALPNGEAVSGSVNAVYVTAPSATSVTIRNSSLHVVATGTTDAAGAYVAHDLPAGKGYSAVLTANGTSATSPSFAVLSTTPPAASLYKSVTLHEGINYLPMRDGISLAATVRLPLGKTLKDGPFPTVVEYSGYSTAAPSSLLLAELGTPGHSLSDPLLPSSATAVGALFAPALGYASVSLQMRGSGCSGGAYDLFGPSLATDGYDAIEEIGNQSWVSNHKVGLVGISYSGISQFAVAGLRPPHLAAIAPMSPTDDLFSTGSPGGIRNTGFAAGWIADRVHDARPAPDGQSWVQPEINAGDSVCAANQKFHGQAQDVGAILSAHTDRTAALYDVRSPALWARSINVPVFLTGGLQDEQTGPQWPALISALSSDKNVWVTMQNGTHVDSFSPAILSRWQEFLSLFCCQKGADRTQFGRVVDHGRRSANGRRVVPRGSLYD